MEIQDLKLFKYIATYQNITKASNYFYVSQSTLSRRIKQLEEEMDAELFYRNNRILSLTPAGKALNEEVDLLIEHLESVQAKISRINHGYGGNLNVITMGSLDPIASKYIKKLTESNEGLHLSIEYYDFDKMLDAIEYHVFDAAFLFDFIYDEYVHTNMDRVLFSVDKFSIICNESIENRSDFLNKLPYLPLVLPRYQDPAIIQKWMNYQRKLLNSNIKTLELNTTQSVLFHIKAGLGFSIVPQNQMKRNYNLSHTKFLDIENFFECDTKINTYLVFNKNNNNPNLAKLIEIVKEGKNI